MNFRGRNRVKLRSKILLLVIPLVVIPLLWLGWTAYARLEDVSRSTALGQMANLLDQTG